MRNILVDLLALACIASVNAANPVFSASLNGGEDTFLQGDAAVFELELIHPNAWDDPPITPIQIALANGQAWTNALKTTIRSGTNTPAWPIAMVPVISATLTLDAEKLGRIFFVIAPQDTALLAPGAYSIQFTLDTRSNAAPNTWSGIARTPRLDINVETVPATLTAQQLRRRQLGLAQYNSLRGQNAAAQIALDTLLAAQPTNLTAFQLKAEILQASQNFAEALNATDAALNLIYQINPDPPEPPRGLLRLHSALARSLSPAEIRIDSATASAGQLTIRWPGIAGITYRLESSSNLQSWSTALYNLTESNGAVTATIPITPGARFYRVAID